MNDSPLNGIDPTGLCDNGLPVCPWEWVGQQRDNAGAAWGDFYNGTGPIGGAVTHGFGAVADPAYAPEDVGQPLDMAHLRVQDSASGVGSALPFVHGMDQLAADVGIDTSGFDYPNCLFQTPDYSDPTVRSDIIQKAIAVGVGADTGSAGNFEQMHLFPQTKPARGNASQLVRWVDENANMPQEARNYQSSATGVSSNWRTGSSQAPQLTYRVGQTTRTARFDGLDGDVLVDRKLSITFYPASLNEARRQSEALSQNGLTGRWEVPTIEQKRQAKRLFRKLGITNIRATVVVP